jgi:syntaxin 7
MSFNNDLEAVVSNQSHRYRDYPEFESISTAIDNQLHHINATHLLSIKKLLGRPATDSLSTELVALFDTTTESFKTLNESVKSLNSHIKQLASQHEDVELINYLKQKENIQINLIKDSLGNFKRLQAEYSQMFPNTSLDIVASPSGTTSTSPQQQQQQQQSIQITYEPLNAEELEQQTLTIQQREVEINKINQDTHEINEIFENLSSIIQEQQFSIDNIENNILNYSNEAHNASNELRRAERYQRRSGGRYFCCLLILLGVMGFIILVMTIF